MSQSKIGKRESSVQKQLKSNRGRKAKEASKLAKYFIKSNAKEIRSDKFIDDSTKTFIRKFVLKSLYKDDEFKDLFVAFRRLCCDFEKIDSNRKGNLMRQALAENEVYLDIIISRLRENPNLSNILGGMLKIKYIGEVDHKGQIFKALFDEICAYVKAITKSKKKSLKHDEDEEDDDDETKPSDNEDQGVCELIDLDMRNPQDFEWCQGLEDIVWDWDIYSWSGCNEEEGKISTSNFSAFDEDFMQNTDSDSFVEGDRKKTTAQNPIQDPLIKEDLFPSLIAF